MMMTVNQRVIGSVGHILAVCRKKDRTDTALKAVFLLLQMADLVLTLVAARSGWVELNPIMRAQLDSLAIMALVKFVIPGLVSWFVPGRLLIPAILLLCGVIGWNLKEMICLALI
jgi:hypothetical protein